MHHKLVKGNVLLTEEVADQILHKLALWLLSLLLLLLLMLLLLLKC